MDNRSKTAVSVLAMQSAITLLVSTAVFSFGEARAALAAATGGGICIATTGLFSLRLFAGAPELSADRFLLRFYRAELQKLVLMVGLLLAALLWLELPGLPLVSTFAAAMIANWFVLLISLKP